MKLPTPSAPGARDKYWFIELYDRRTGDSVTLPPGDNFPAAVRLLNTLADIYGGEYVQLICWEVYQVDTDEHLD